MSARDSPFDALVQAVTAPPDLPKRRRGRPPGIKRDAHSAGQAWVRALETLRLFENARRSGLGHTQALAATVSAIKDQWPGLRGVNRA